MGAGKDTILFEKFILAKVPAPITIELVSIDIKIQPEVTHSY